MRMVVAGEVAVESPDQWENSQPGADSAVIWAFPPSG